MLIEAPIGNIFAQDTQLQVPEVIDWLDLTWQDCRLRALRKTTRGGQEIRILLRLGTRLRHGDLLNQSTPPIIVHVVPCPVIVVVPGCPIEAAMIAYELGNQHFPIELTPTAIIVPPMDGQVEAILNRLKFSCRTEVRRFDPTADSMVPVSFSPGFELRQAARETCEIQP
jgi:urease accessory protein UreE